MPAQVPAEVPDAEGSAVASWGSADLPGLGDQVLARVVVQQLSARLPGWTAAPFAPFGWHRPSRADGGFVAEPLGEPTDTRIARLTRRNRLSVVAPGFPLGAGLSRLYGTEVAAEAFFSGAVDVPHPVLPLAVRVADPLPDGVAKLVGRAPVASVRDRHSHGLLGSPGGVAVVAHPGLLADGLVGADVLATRTAQARQLGILPVGTEYLVLHLPDALVERLPRLHPGVRKLADEVGAEAVVVLSSGPLPADAAEQVASLGWYGVPADVVVEDRLAVLAGAAAVAAGDEHAAAVATALGRPWVLYDPAHTERAVIEEFAPGPLAVDRPSQLVAGLRRWTKSEDERAERLAGARAGIAAHLDAVADAALAAPGVAGDRPLPDLAAENRALRTANERLRTRLVLDRHRLVERLLELDGAEASDSAAAERLRAEVDHERELRRAAEALHGAAVAELAAERAELTALRATKLYRWSRPARALYGRFRRG